MRYQWEIAPFGAGYTIQNMQTGTYLSMKELYRRAPVFAGHFPASWQVVTVKVRDENAEMIECVLSDILTHPRL